jgi:hypothetical protein
VIPLANRPLTSEQRRLLEQFDRLGAAGRESLLAFAEFLVTRAEASPQQSLPPERPRVVPRPEGESVVAAIRRLAETYPMLDRGSILHETAGLMSAHIMQGRPAVEVVAELETVFQRHYHRYREAREG